MPIMVGLFNLIISDDPFGVMDASLHFHVDPGMFCSVLFVCSFSEECSEVC